MIAEFNQSSSIIDDIDGLSCYENLPFLDQPSPSLKTKISVAEGIARFEELFASAKKESAQDQGEVSDSNNIHELVLGPQCSLFDLAA